MYIWFLKTEIENTLPTTHNTQKEKRNKFKTPLILKKEIGGEATREA